MLAVVTLVTVVSLREAGNVLIVVLLVVIVPLCRLLLLSTVVTLDTVVPFG